MRKFFLIMICICLFFLQQATAQLKSFILSPNGDTLNKVDKKGWKQGRWVMRVEPLRGEDGFEDEGVFKDDKKEGVWRHYTLKGDPIGFETYLHGGKDGKQQYYTPFGELVREESWKGFNPDAPYDTIAIYGTGSGEIIDYKIVKAEPYSVKQGIWKFYESFTGRLYKTEEWDRNNLVVPKPAKQDEVTSAGTVKKKVVPKTQEMLDWEKKNRGKKKVLKSGETRL